MDARRIPHPFSTIYMNVYNIFVYVHLCAACALWYLREEGEEKNITGNLSKM